jgi:hypothetical protein
VSPTLGASGGAAEEARVAAGAVRALGCPSCGAAVALRAMDWTQTVACASCAAVLDARDPNLRVLREAARRRGPAPLIPLGTRGEWRGAAYDVIGFQERAIGAGGVSYAWREYLLFNPYRGFRYLTSTTATGTTSSPCPRCRSPRRACARRYATAAPRSATSRPRAPRPPGCSASSRGRRAPATPVTAKDYVAPPYVMSAEEDRDETTWSLGEYVDGAAVWEAFGLPGRPPAPRGVYANQPSPHGRSGSLWPLAALLLSLLFAATVARYSTARDAVVFEQGYAYTPGSAAVDDAGGPTAFVTPSFDLPPGRFGGAANVEVDTEASLDDNWMAVDYALVDEETGRSYDLARDVSYYSGRDPEDGSRWTEGGRRDRARIGPVPAGRYFLRAEPSGGEARPGAGPVRWTVTVRRDVPSPALPLLAALALLVPPVVGLARSAAFEVRRWAESDYGAAAGEAAAALSDDE